MRIRNFTPFLDKMFANSNIKLNNSSLVIDGHNFFYYKYNEANLPFIFGCECDRFASFLTENLKIFQKAKVKCYFLFKGGNENNEKLLNLDPLEKTNHSLKDKYKPYEPLFDREVYKQVLDDMGFDYVICEVVSKRECVALAQKLNCPILALDIEYFFFGVPYINGTTLKFNPHNNILQCKLYYLDTLMQMFKVNNKQIAIFTAVFDEKSFSSSFLNKLLKNLRLSLSYRDRYLEFLKWLTSYDGRRNALQIMSNSVTESEYLQIKSEIERKYKNYINIQEAGGLPTQYFLNKNRCQINKADPQWFAKGVIWKFIPIPYINIWKWKIVEGSWCIEDKDAVDAVLLAAPIIKYAFDLLTNFKNEELIYKGRRRTQQLTDDENEPLDTDTALRVLNPVRKPIYGSRNVFENGWGNIRTFKLFEHFLLETFQMSDLKRFDEISSDARLLVISLVYFSRQKSVDVVNEVTAVLLSYVMLGVVLDDASRGHTTRQYAPTPYDCKHAKRLLKQYFTISEDEVSRILDKKILHPLVEFQHCLRHMNFLNTLCGSPFAPTIYSKTYNGTFVYKILYCIKQNYQGNSSQFLEEKLQRAATALSLLKSLIDFYNEIK